MLNKKAIAAFAAGATLLSGLAFAAPAFAEAAKDAAKTEKTEKKADPKHEAAVKAAEAKVEATKKSLEKAKDDAKKAQKAFDKQDHKFAELNDTLDDKKEALKAEQAKQAEYKKLQDAKTAAEKAEKEALKKLSKHATAAVTDYAGVAAATAKDGDKEKAAFNAAKAEVELKHAAVVNATAAAAAGQQDNSAAVTAAQSAVDDAQDAVDTAKADDGAYGEAKKNLNDANAKVDMYTTLLASYEADLAKLKGETPKPNPVTPGPVTPGPVTPAPSANPTVAAASGALMHANVAYNEAAAAYGTAFNELKDAQAKFDAAETQLNSLNAQVKAANDNYQNNFVLAGKADTDAGKAAKADLDNAVALAQAYASHEYADAKKTRDEKKAKLDKAGKALNAAKAQYANAYLAAVKVEASAVKGFPDPRNLADAPVDVFSPEGKAAAGKLAAAAAQAGKAGAAAAANGAAAAAGANGAKAAAGENGGKKKNNAGEDAKKKLGQTGATVALAAVAASVLAGVGAALRKIRH